MKQKINLIKVINEYLIKNGTSPSELHCQKIIFFCYGLFKKEFKKPLLEKVDFRAWKYGVVELNYRKISKGIEKELINNFNCTLTIDEYNYIIKIIDILAKQSPWTLVELSHASYAWYANYNLNDSKIDEQDIDRTFDNISVSF